MDPKKKERLSNISLGAFIIAKVLLLVFIARKLTGFSVIKDVTPSPVYGLSSLVIIVLSAIVYFWIQKKNYP